MRNIAISTSLEKRLIPFLDSQLFYMINEVDSPEDYSDDITACIELLRSLGRDATADRWQSAYEREAAA